MIGCEGPSTDNSGPSYDPDVGSLPDVVETDKNDDGQNVWLCEHKYSDQRDFNYVGQVKSFTETMFGESVTTYTFVLLNGEKHYLSGDELANYDCN